MIKCLLKNTKWLIEKWRGFFFFSSCMYSRVSNKRRLLNKRSFEKLYNVSWLFYKWVIQIFDRELCSMSYKHKFFLLLLLLTLVKNLLIITGFVILCKLWNFLQTLQNYANFVDLCKFFRMVKTLFFFSETCCFIRNLAVLCVLCSFM